MLVSVADISRRLSDRVEAVCQRLLPGGKSAQGEWVCGSVAGNEGDSLKVKLHGAHVGNWRDWANQDDHGDLIDLWSKSRGIPMPDAIREAKEFLGITEKIIAAPRAYVLPSKNGVKPLSADGSARKYLVEKRKLLPETLRHFSVQGDEESRAIVFPCYDIAGKLINRSFRTLPKDGEKKDVWQDKGCAPCLFGWSALNKSAFAERKILLCEGQIDCMTWFQWGVPALSIPNGTGMTWIEFEWENLAAFDQIYLSFDTDGAGAEICRKAIDRLGKHRCLVVTMPKKDANDCLLAGYGPDDARQWLADAKAPTISGLIRACDLAQRIKADMEPRPEPFTLPFLRGNWPDGGFYPRPAEVTLWTGVSNDGKSTMLNQMVAAMLSANINVFLASLEMKIERLIRRMVQGFGNGTVTEKFMDVFLSECGQNLVVADCVGYIEEDMLFDMLYFSFRRYGVTQFVIDSLMRIKGLEEDYPKQGDFMNRLQKFAKECDAHVHLVAHPAKPEKGQKSIGNMNIKGSSLIPNNADNILSISRNKVKEQLREDGRLTSEQKREMHDAELRITKQRENGHMAKILLKFNPHTQLFYKHHQD